MITVSERKINTDIWKITYPGSPTISQIISMTPSITSAVPKKINSGAYMGNEV